MEPKAEPARPAEDDSPLVYYERVLGRLHAAINEALEDAPELQAAGAVFYWRVPGGESVPFGMVIGRGGPVRRAPDWLGLLGQTRRLLEHELRGLDEALAQVQQAGLRVAQEARERLQQAQAARPPAEGEIGPGRAS